MMSDLSLQLSLDLYPVQLDEQHSGVGNVYRGYVLSSLASSSKELPLVLYGQHTGFMPYGGWEWAESVNGWHY